MMNTKQIYFLLNSLAGGGAEAVAVRLSEHIPIAKFILIEKDVKYQPNKEIIFLSKHSIKTNPIFKTLSIPLYAYRLFKKIEHTQVPQRRFFLRRLSTLQGGYSSQNILPFLNYLFNSKIFNSLLSLF